MRKYLIVLLAFLFISCNTSVNSPSSETKSDSESRDSATTTVSYSKLKVENKLSSGQFIYLVELPNYTISPLEIRSGESATFELNKGMYYYENVTIHIRYGAVRSSFSEIYVRKNFKDGETTVVTVGN